MKNLNDQQVDRTQLADRVFDKLMEWIVTGKLKMGDKLNTEDLANQLGVSRMPIRDAIRSLEQKGLAESVPYSGTRLVQLTEEDVRQIYIARAALEPVAAKYACDQITKKTLERLSEIHAEYINIITRDQLDALDIYQHNRSFHFTIYKASNLERICDMIESLWDTLSFFKLIYGQKLIDTHEGKLKMIAEHQSYLDALRDRDGERVYKLMYANLSRRCSDIPYSTDACFQELETMACAL